MFIPTPKVPVTNATVINETIVYSDTVLNLKDIGANLKIKSIENVSEFELESCLQEIFESNQNVIFNTIQYSKNDKKIYFYTDKEITTKTWDERKIFKYRQITNKTEILEELKKVLSYQKNKDPNVVSLKIIHNILSNKRRSFDKMKSNYEAKIDEKLKKNFDAASYCIIYDFDYNKKTMEIGFREYFTNEISSIKFTKKAGDLCIIKSESVYANEHLINVGSELSELYDNFLLFESFFKDKKYGTLPVNSNFKINISPWSLGITDNTFPYQFKIRKIVPKEDFEYECNSFEIINIIKGSENKLYENIFININDCPKWMQEELRNLRYEELVEEDRCEKALAQSQKLEELQKAMKEQKKQKRLELKRKILPWIK